MSVYIPPSVRGPIYAVFALLGLVIGAVQVAFSAAEAGRPLWLTVALAVYPFVGAGIGFTASSNTPAPPIVAPDGPALPGDGEENEDQRSGNWGGV